VLVGCGGERQASSAAARDTAATAAVDTALPGADTSSRSVDTTVTASRDTAATPSRDSAARRDTAAASPQVARTKPQTKPTTPRPTAVKPTPSRPDTSAGPARPDTSSQASATSNGTGAPLRDPYHRAPLDTVAPVVYDGWKQFNLNCARCHGEDVQGTTIAPHLIVSLRPDGPINTKQIFMQTVCAGRPAKGMPSWCSLGMEMSTIEAIYSYVKGRSDGKIHPGRPARRAG
jgi:mono/diheme cytochrome c family protein